MSCVQKIGERSLQVLELVIGNHTILKTLQNLRPSALKHDHDIHVRQYRDQIPECEGPGRMDCIGAERT